MADIEEKKINRVEDEEDDDDDDEDDEDYVPELETSGSRQRRRRGNDSGSDDDSADDDIDDEEDEDDVEDEEEGEEGIGRKTKRKRGNCRKRRRKSKTRKLDSEDTKLETEANKKPSVNVDDLWAEFKRETEDSQSNSCPLDGGAAQDKPKSSPPKTVTITQEYDFAGEVVKVTKEVAADSKEAKSELFKPSSITASQSSSNQSPAPQPSQSSSSTADSASKASPAPPKPTGPPIIRRSGGLGSLTANLGKKQKMSTLQKTALDWQQYKQDEGLEDELQAAIRSKGSYTERQSFLARADLRQFEIEKSIREKTRKAPSLGPPP